MIDAFQEAYPGQLEQLATLTDPADPYPAELVGQLARALLATTARLDAVEAVVQKAREYINAPSASQDADGDWRDWPAEAYPRLVAAIDAYDASTTHTPREREGG